MRANLNGIALLATLSEMGITVTVEGSDLCLRPPGKLTDDLRFLIRENKPELVRLLRRDVAADEVAVFASDARDWLCRCWCYRYRHLVGWRDVYGGVKCLTCHEPALPEVVSTVLFMRNERIVECDSFESPVVGVPMEYIGQRALKRRRSGHLSIQQCERMEMLDLWRCMDATLRLDATLTASEIGQPIQAAMIAAAYGMDAK